MKLLEISQEAPGTKVAGIFRLTDFSVKNTRNGSKYGTAALSDLSCSLPAKLWDITGEVESLCRAHRILAVEGVLEAYNGRPQVIISRVASPSPAEIGAVIGDLVEHSRRDSGEMMAQITAAVTSFRNQDFRNIIQVLLLANKTEREKFARYPAAVKYHHAYVGGLLQHTAEVLGMAQDICAREAAVDRELLLAAAILHDYGKLRELAVDEFGLPVGFTKEGKLLGHIYLGMEAVERAGQQVKADREICLVLKHCIYSHHGQPDWGSPIEPVIKEAQILHYLDNLSAKNEFFTRTEQTIAPGQFGVADVLRREIYRRQLD